MMPFIRYWQILKSKRLTPMNLVIALIVAQCVALVWFVAQSEWILHRGTLISLAVDPIDDFEPFQGVYFEFVPTVFRHSFPSAKALSVGQKVAVIPVDSAQTQWAILPAVPSTNIPYFVLPIKSANSGNFFIEPPFNRIVLDHASREAVSHAIGDGKSPKKAFIFILIRQYKDHSIIQGIQVGNRRFYQ